MLRSVFRLTVADERLTDLHAELHDAGGAVDTSASLDPLPECVLYALDHSLAKGTGIVFGADLKFLHYGSGHSTVIDWVGRILDTHHMRLAALQTRATTREMWEEVEPTIRFVMDLHASGMTDAGMVDGYEAAFGRRARPTIEVVKFDPAIPEFRRMPVDRFALAYCLDMLATVPLIGRRNATAVTPLRNTLNLLAALSKGIYVTIPTRMSLDELPNGLNAHCTLMSGPEWHGTLQQVWGRGASPVLSRDMTGVAFTSWQPSRDIETLQYDLAEAFGPIDRLQWPPRAALPVEKSAKLRALQSHKLRTMLRNAMWWREVDYTAERRAGFHVVMGDVRLPIEGGALHGARLRNRLC